MRKTFLAGILILVLSVVGSMSLGKNSIEPQAVTAASVDYFLRIEGIEGNSRSAQHGGEIEILSWSWGENEPGIDLEQPGQSSRSGGKAHLQDISVTKWHDKASPMIMEVIAEGKIIREVVLTGVKNGESGHEFLEITLENVTITSYQTEAASGDIPVDHISLNYEIIKVKYHEQNDDGTTGETVEFGWDLKKNKKV